MAHHTLFVFGTLKQGFPLHEEALGGVPKAAGGRTVQRFPMLIAGPWFAPMMINEPGQGLRVQGELYEIDTDRLTRIDRLESVPLPGNLRLAIEIERDDGRTCMAIAYMKTRALARPARTGPLASYDDRRFVPFANRPPSWHAERARAFKEQASRWLTGRCLCGDVRWTARAAPKLVHHCHCTMCRRWTGAAFATLVWFERSDVDWQGAPHCFRSSPIAVRSHCARCGTPLALAYDGRTTLALVAGTLDEPERIAPVHNYGCESLLSWSVGISALPMKTTKESW